MRVSWIPCLSLLLLAGCLGSDRRTGDRPGTINQTFAVHPSRATLAAGQQLQFSAAGPWAGTATWTVLPATAGTVDANGLFTARESAGQCTVVATWNQDVRYTGMATVTLLPPPPPAVSSPDLTAASGAQQQSPDGSLRHGAVVGEPVSATRSTDSSGAMVVRHGFSPAPR